MGERKGQNKYYPPDFDYKKHKSLAGYHGQHPLRERARKLHMGILIIRFEMPYNIWCDGCNSHVAMGVRYNAEKSKIGNYYSTPIYKFRMKCHLCDNHYEIKTDPQNHDYVIISGARRKEQRWDPHENEQIVPEDRATQKKLALDSMYKLEHGTTDQSRGKSALPAIAEIVDHQAAHKDDFLLNQLARKKFRDAKRASANVVARDDEIKKKFSLDLDLVSESKDDARVAELLQYSTIKTYDERQKAKRQAIEARPLFATSSQTTSDQLTSTTPSTSTTSTSSDRSSSAVSKRKLVSLNRIKQITESSRARQRGAAFLSRSSASGTVGSLSNIVVKSQKRLGVAVQHATKRKAAASLSPADSSSSDDVQFKRQKLEVESDNLLTRSTSVSAEERISGLPNTETNEDDKCCSKTISNSITQTDITNATSLHEDTLSSSASTPNNSLLKLAANYDSCSSSD